jgi:hypothetical protein
MALAPTRATRPSRLARMTAAIAAANLRHAGWPLVNTAAKALPGPPTGTGGRITTGEDTGAEGRMPALIPSADALLRLDAGEWAASGRRSVATRGTWRHGRGNAVALRTAYVTDCAVE